MEEFSQMQIPLNCATQNFNNNLNFDFFGSIMDLRVTQMNEEYEFGTKPNKRAKALDELLKATKKGTGSHNDVSRIKNAFVYIYIE